MKSLTKNKKLLAIALAVAVVGFLFLRRQQGASQTGIQDPGTGMPVAPDPTGADTTGPAGDQLAGLNDQIGALGQQLAGMTPAASLGDTGGFGWADTSGGSMDQGASGQTPPAAPGNTATKQQPKKKPPLHKKPPKAKPKPRPKKPVGHPAKTPLRKIPRRPTVKKKPPVPRPGGSVRTGGSLVHPTVPKARSYGRPTIGGGGGRPFVAL